MRVVVGVDSGGSKTRALAVSLDGERAGYAESGGGNPSHDARHVENVREAIRLAGEGREVVRIVAGIAGFDRPERDVWAHDAVAVPGMSAASTVVNDAEIAHFGAFAGGSGIVTIQGTGSLILAILEDGRRVSNGAFFHYARAGAVWVGIRAVQKLLRDPLASREDALREAAFRLWKVESVEALREAVSRQFDLTEVERSRRYGTLARTVTASAEAGGFISRVVCTAAVREIVEGILLLGPMFASEEVPAAMIGSCGRSAPIRRGVEDRLRSSREKRYRMVEPTMTPLVGAVSMALREEGIELDLEAAGRLMGSGCD